MKVFAVLNIGDKLQKRVWDTMGKFEMEMSWIDERIVYIATSKQFLDGLYSDTESTVNVNREAYLMMNEMHERYIYSLTRKGAKSSRDLKSKVLYSIPKFSTNDLKLE